LAATFLLAFSTYHLGNSIKIRGYSEMAFFAVASFYFLWGAMETSRWRAWLFYALTMTLAIYSHFYAFTLLATQGIIVAIWLVIRAIQQRPKMSVFLSRQVIPPLVSGIGSAIMAILLLSPVLLPRFFQDFVAADTSYPVSTNSLLDFLLPYFDLFNLYSGAVSVWSALLFLILTLAGVFYLFQLKPGLAVMLLGWLLIPCVNGCCGSNFY
jgi:uncharacterized membrane protein